MYNLFIYLSQASSERSIGGIIAQISITLLFVFLFDKGVKSNSIRFSWRTRVTEDNLIEAYIILSAEMMKGDRGSSKEKIKYILNYFHRHFPEGYYSFRESLNYAYTNPIQLESIGKWLSKRHFKKKDHLQIVYFLCGLCIIDGKFSQKEIKSLRTIVKELKVTDKELDGIIAMYQSNEDEARRSQWEKSEDAKIQPSQKKICCDIIGVPTTASFYEVKKAYRNMVKLHHPDRFHNESQEQQQIAQAKFITIQKAYEVLEKLIS